MSDSKSLNHDPLSEADAILTQDFYGQDRPGTTSGRDHRRSRSKPKPTHYKVICISMYNTDIERLEEKVAELKRRGYTKANKSQLIRMALSQIDLDKLTLPQP
ncbi:MAG TPA: hypothetical protein VNM90_23745 [Haliangium sp.]|nr:hypothetical protein [Haliangium sp.]